MNILAAVLMALLMSMTTPPAEEMPAEEPSMDYIGTYTISAYSYEEGGGENYYTASGMTPEPYVTIATSNEFSFGTELYIEGVGTCIVMDRGNFPSDRIDLHIGHDSPDAWGLQKRAVYRVN